MYARFNFGENWKAFSEKISEQDYAEAKESIQKLIPVIRGRSFLDVGCGSGLFSAAAAGLGASHVAGFDIDPICVEVARKNLKIFSGYDKAINVSNSKFLTASILEFPEDIGVYDIVYCWGVLHHTGRMWESCKSVSKLVDADGILVVSIYNKTVFSGVSKIIKKTYTLLPFFLKRLMILICYPIIFAAKLLVTLKNPLRMKRGMSFYHNVVDWVGGYPYEYASISEVSRFFESLGFSTGKVNKADVPTGCNEFVFKKKV